MRLYEVFRVSEKKDSRSCWGKRKVVSKMKRCLHGISLVCKGFIQEGGGENVKTDRIEE